ncbi:MAG: sulfite exporter TauE/SafE family protein [Firmicutes bacterium]|nr:sulfite exporter TauE/SafE family protein [Bacillota bacterium]
MFTGQWLMTSIVVYVSATLQAITGFGFALIAVPLLLMILPPRVAVCTNMAVSLCSLLVLSWRTREHANRTILKWLVVGSLAGIPAGTYIITRCDVAIIKTLASVTTLVIGCVFLARALPARRNQVLSSREPVPLGSRWYLLAGGISGLLTTSVSMPGPPVILCLSHAGAPKQEFRATSSIYFAVVYTISILVLALSGVMTVQVLAFAASLVPVAILGNIAGDRVFSRVSQPVFEKVVPVVLVLTAVSNIIRR